MSIRKLYLEICVKFDTNLTEVFNYLSEDYHRKRNHERYQLLKNISQQGYNLKEVLCCYKYHNKFKGEITFSVSLALLFHIKYIRQYCSKDPQNDASMQIFEAQVITDKIPEERLMDIIITFFATDKLSYS